MGKTMEQVRPDLPFLAGPVPGPLAELPSKRRAN